MNSLHTEQHSSTSTEERTVANGTSGLGHNTSSRRARSGSGGSRSGAIFRRVDSRGRLRLVACEGDVAVGGTGREGGGAGRGVCAGGFGGLGVEDAGIL